MVYVTAFTCDNPPSLCHSEGGYAKVSECFGSCPFVKASIPEAVSRNEILPHLVAKRQCINGLLLMEASGINPWEYDT